MHIALVAALTTFALIAIAEMGDKTQLVTFCLACDYSKVPVFIGALAGLLGCTLIGILAGELLFQVLPREAVRAGAAILFLVFGVITLRRKEKTEKFECKESHHVVMYSAGLTFSAEFGDKTQLAIIALSASFHQPVAVFFGAAAGFALLVFIGVMAGQAVSKKLSPEKLRYTAAGMFFIVGVAMLVELII